MWTPTFAEVLDDALGMTNADQRLPTGGSAAFTQQPANPFLFFSLPHASAARIPSAAWRLTRTQAGQVTAPGKSGRQYVAAAAPLGLRREARILTADQQRSLDAMKALGATLTADFTERELRREYRRLARRIHPDRHPGATDAERAHLSRQFAELAQHHQRLSMTLQISDC